MIILSKIVHHKTSSMDENRSNYSNNFEKIKQKANSYGYRPNYGRVKNNGASNNLVRLIVVGGMMIGGYFYLKKKIKNVFNEIFNPKEPELKSCGSNASEYDKFSEKREKVFTNINKKDVIDAEYNVIDLSNNNSIRPSSFSCQFSE